MSTAVAGVIASVRASGMSPVTGAVWYPWILTAEVHSSVFVTTFDSASVTGSSVPPLSAGTISSSALASSVYAAPGTVPAVVAATVWTG